MLKCLGKTLERANLLGGTDGRAGRHGGGREAFSGREWIVWIMSITVAARGRPEAEEKRIASGASTTRTGSRGAAASDAVAAAPRGARAAVVGGGAADERGGKGAGIIQNSFCTGRHAHSRARSSTSFCGGNKALTPSLILSCAPPVPVPPELSAARPGFRAREDGDAVHSSPPRHDKNEAAGTIRIGRTRA